jgi:HrpA-like RNA helicase
MAVQTLFVKGKLVEVPGGDPQDVLDQYRPLDYITQWVEERIGMAGTVENRVLVLHSSTGSGKSTILPPELYHKFFAIMGKRNICCTQPRVLTATEIPKTILPFHTGGSGRVALKMGDNIGFQTGVIAKIPTRGMIFMTVGVLKQQLNIMTPQEIARRYSFIIIDEAHERSVDTDLVLYMMKRLIANLKGSKDCPFLIVMSATFDPVKFAKYLSSPLESVSITTIIRVTGFSHPIHDENGFLKYDSPNYIKSAVETVAMVHAEHLDDVLPRDELLERLSSKAPKAVKKLDDDAVTERIAEQTFRDILVFVAGESDARQILEQVAQLNVRNELFRQYPVLPIQLMGVDVVNHTESFMNMTKELSKLSVDVGGKSRKPTRRVIVATNVAETGVTINTLRHVIDSGVLKSSEYDPIYRANLLVTRPVTQGMHMQRRGRAGRKAPGYAWYLYTKATFDALQKDQFPAIIKEDITLDVLSLIIKETDTEGLSVSETLFALQKNQEWQTKMRTSVVDITKFDLLDAPSADTLHTALDRLYIAGAITIDSTPTMLGIVISKFRMLTLESIKTILAGYAWQAPVIDLITIAAAAQIRSDISADRDKEPNYEALLKFGSSIAARMRLMASCDFCSLLLVWNQYQLHCVNVIESIYANTKYQTIDDWCLEHGLSLGYLEQLTEAREDIIHNMASIGLNPFANDELSIAHRTELDFGDWVRIIKQCCWEGYKSNLLSWNQSLGCYETRHGSIKVTVDRKYIMTAQDCKTYGVQNPKYLIYDDLTFRQNRKNQYPPQVRFVSVMDGYVPIDPKYDS